LKVKIDNIEKYATALNNLIGVDSAYFTGDEDVDTLVELINIANQQQTEIEELQKQLEYCEDEGEYWESKYKNAKIEAIKEFAEKLKEKAYLNDGVTGFQDVIVEVNDIDNLIYEMVGEGK
jgi:phage shock protein A